MLTLQYIPHCEIESLNSELRIRKLLDIVRKERIIILEGRLTGDEEARLIQATMESIDDSFKGIEIGTIEGENGSGILRKVVANIFFKGRSGITIIGPASIVKEIKKDPRKIELLTTEKATKKRTKVAGKKMLRTKNQ